MTTARETDTRDTTARDTDTPHNAARDTDTDPARGATPDPVFDAAEVTLGELVTSRPAAARVLERHGLDYCCGGARTLADACEQRGVSPDVVLDDVVAAAPAAPEPWAEMGPASLVDHLESTHHRYLHAELPRLGQLADKVASVHGGRHPELVEVRRVYAELRADLEPHLMKEERVLFPLVRELAATDPSGPPPSFHCGSLRNPITVMLAEHDTAGDLLEELRDLTSGYTTPGDGCASYRALYDGLAELESDTHLHVHKENNLLFPAVIALEDEVAPAGARGHG